MNKSDFIDAISERAELAKADVTRALDSLMHVVTDALQKGEQVVLTGWGTFSVDERKARDGRNPRTGETIKIPAKKLPKFKAGKQFKDKIAAGA